MLLVISCPFVSRSSRECCGSMDTQNNGGKRAIGQWRRDIMDSFACYVIG
jgi:hypothetical protein